MNFLLVPFVTLVALGLSTGCLLRNFSRPEESKNSAAKPAANGRKKIILFGDIQLAGEYRFNEDIIQQRPIEKSILLNSPLRVADFDENNPVDALKAEKPDALINTGDIVDLNNGQRFVVNDKQGKTLEQWNWEIDEWGTILNRLRPMGVPIFPTAGNHEGYGTIDWIFQKEDDGKLRFMGAPISGIVGAERQLLLKKWFPELSGGSVTFLPDSATYYSDQGDWCLLSLDVNNFAYPDKPLRQVLIDRNANSDPQIDDWKKRYEEAIAKAESERQRAYVFAKESISACNAKQPAEKLKPVIVLTHFPFFSGRADLYKDEKGKEKYGAEFHDEGIRKTFVPLFDELNVPLVVSAHEHFYLRYFSDGFEKAGYVKPRSTTYFNTSTFGGSFTSEGAERVIKVGRLNESGKAYASLEETPMMKESGKTLSAKVGPTYTSLVLSAGKIEVVSRAFNSSNRLWEKFDSFEISNTDSSGWTRGELRN